MQASQTSPIEFVGPWYRIGALLWDLVILVALAGGAIAGLVGDQLESEHGGQMSGLLVLMVATVYVLGSWILFARTGGQWLCSSRIVDFHRGGKPRPWQFLVRFVVAPLSVLVLGIGFLWSIRQRHRRTWHDLLSRTAVIGDGSLRAPTAAETAEANYCIQPPPWSHASGTQATPPAACPG